jgi:16S rRNA processing protein RimM
MKELLNIGVIVKPQGIKGQLKVMPYTDDINRFKTLKEVIIEDKTYKVTGAIIGAPAVFLSLFGVNDRNLAETFRGKDLYIKRKDAIMPSENRYFIVDLIDCSVYLENGQEVGVITDITQAKTDIITVDCKGKTMRFPFLQDVVVSVDVENKKFIVKEKRLKEISIYED